MLVSKIMSLLDKFNTLTAGRKFRILFWGLFIICLPAIPAALIGGRRIFLNELSDLQFIILGVISCAAYAAILAGAGVIIEMAVKKLKIN